MKFSACDFMALQGEFRFLEVGDKFGQHQLTGFKEIAHFDGSGSLGSLVPQRASSIPQMPQGGVQAWCLQGGSG